jgi:hypothetical protein
MTLILFGKFLVKSKIVILLGFILEYDAEH